MTMRLSGAAAGCLIVGAVMSTAVVAGQERSAPRVTFSKDIAPIVFERCGGCHHPQGAAPFSLLTYAAARQRATLIGQVTKARVMPPWKSEPGYGEFIGHVHLSDAEVDLIQRWVNEGAPEGDPRDLPPTPAWTEGVAARESKSDRDPAEPLPRTGRRTRLLSHFRPPSSGHRSHVRQGVRIPTR